MTQIQEDKSLNLPEPNQQWQTTPACSFHTMLLVHISIYIPKYCQPRQKCYQWTVFSKLSSDMNKVLIWLTVYYTKCLHFPKIFEIKSKKKKDHTVFITLDWLRMSTPTGWKRHWNIRLDKEEKRVCCQVRFSLKPTWSESLDKGKKYSKYSRKKGKRWRGWKRLRELRGCGKRERGSQSRREPWIQSRRDVREFYSS